MTTRNPLPPEFFSSTGLDDNWSLVRTQLLESLREENTAGDNTLDLMLLERTSYLYSAIRQWESGPDLIVAGISQKEHKDLSRLLVSMIESLRAQRDKDFIIEEARAEVMHALMVALREAVEVLPVEQRKEVMSRVAVFMAGQDD